MQLYTIVAGMVAGGKRGGKGRIRHASFPADAPAVLGIWREFIADAGISLTYQANDAEFADVPGEYAAPGGCVLVATGGDGVDGCVALPPSMPNCAR